MKTLFETFDMIQADFLRSQLELVGIKAHIYSPDIGGTRPSLAYVSPVRVLVGEQQFEEAKKVLDDLGFTNDA